MRARAATLALAALAAAPGTAQAAVVDAGAVEASYRARPPALVVRGATALSCCARAFGAAVYAPGAAGRARSAGPAAARPVGAARDQLRAQPPRAAQRLRRALERGGPGGEAGRELRVRRPLRRARPRDRRGDRAAPWPQRPRRRHLLPGALAALEPRLRRAARQRRGEPLRPARRRGRWEAAPTRPSSRCACSPARGRRMRCAASPPPPGASRRRPRPGPTAPGSRPASRT